MTSETRQPGRRRFLSYAAAVPAAAGIVPMQTQAQEVQRPTARDAMGPFFVANTPVMSDLNRFGKPGEPMRITGRIMDAGSPDTPIAGAVVEIWQTDGTGTYHPEGNGDYTDYADEEIDLRGTVIADAEGRIEVMSLYPGAYVPRPRHIHYRISAEGFRTLVTQHYVDVDPDRRPHRTAQVDRSVTPILFPAPTVYLERV